ncbi:hypothetical protein J595_04002 [Acinetobacter sp. 1592897]|nr:hypothetical protein [Acinetobacter sp. 1592897]EYT12805.1 hypothetical protein J595_04002 [Acinetobacter sp. 1592897]
MLTQLIHISAPSFGTFGSGDAACKALDKSYILSLFQMPQVN